MRRGDALRRRFGLWLGSLLLLVTVVAVAQDATEDADKEEPRRPQVRLPNYYGRVVSGQQREKIYAIQREYAPRIEAIEKQLQELVAERDAKMRGVLTPEQQKQIDELAAQAAERRERARAERRAASEQSPDESDSASRSE